MKTILRIHIEELPISDDRRLYLPKMAERHRCVHLCAHVNEIAHKSGKGDIYAQTVQSFYAAAVAMR